ncbi:hypothetical protein Q8G35_12380 [Peribacillus simplex]|uniref:Uncharacterized protein n=2 Tax=Peribacillus TaxID=2675229 RepID=A0AA90P218_9BACI|nr:MULTISPECIES: hypothetical protein [Peribacillus]MDP1419208.1 hypothetical protein [Peribacillus simplex]MDP1452154.1 hypothetical protein [Peribacillus frigoritolerans]
MIKNKKRSLKPKEGQAFKKQYPTRDTRGRFAKKSDMEFKLRSTKLVKLKGTYGSFLVKERLFFNNFISATITIGLISTLIKIIMI